MIATFTKTSTITTNDTDMEQMGYATTALGPEEVAFYNSLVTGLNSLQRNPKKETLQSILTYSENYPSEK
ncbi:hypothetical protein [uncultured Mucilaginibacter sp.]|uniref:hypothetical protein n=1 Tax=uncultured Mucilaginibacter sp. TaxID=797541 RepID=UPI002600A0F7|nr:hypothetical protein [uncultured Mucilaginibacter sp.]